MIDIAPFSGAPFWAVLVAFAVAYAMLVRSTAARSVRNLFMVGVSFAVVFLAQSGDAQGAFLLGLIIALALVVFLAGRALAERKEGRGRWQVVAPILLVLVFLGYFKYSAFQEAVNTLMLAVSTATAFEVGPEHRHLYVLGVSYFSFKFIHFLADCRSGKIGDLDLLTFVNYTLFFPSFFGGPINRYSAFEDDLSQARPPAYLEGGQRIVTGLFKKVVLAGNLYPVSVVALDLADPASTPLRAVLSVYAYALFVYFDFSGYTDLAIGAGKLVGVELPENFNYPFFRRNLRDFWGNWHMSLTTWLTEYIYWPLARKLRHVRQLAARPVGTSNIAIIVTFIVCGVWHGDGLNFLVWGTYHGVGLAILNGYALLVRKVYPRKLQRFVKSSRLAYGLSNFITVQYAVFGFLLFGCDFVRLREFFQIFS